jgi:hypothetical protein
MHDERHGNSDANYQVRHPHGAERMIHPREPANGTAQAETGALLFPGNFGAEPILLLSQLRGELRAEVV